MQMFPERSEGAKRPEFGKRGLNRVNETERKLTAMGRLRKAGSRWWAKKSFKKTIGAKKAFKDLPRRRA
jgi:hypothetical protein